MRFIRERIAAAHCTPHRQHRARLSRVAIPTFARDSSWDVSHRLVLGGRFVLTPRVPLFQRIFDFRKEEIEQFEKRLSARHVPGPAYPLRAMLTLGRRPHPAQVLNISAGGIGLLVEGAEAAAIGQAGRVLLGIEGTDIGVDGRIIHREARGSGHVYGVALEFKDFLDQKTYLQILQPIAIGSSLQPVPEDRVVQDEPKFIKRVYRGESDSVLSVWLENSFGTPLHSFEFRMSDYFVRADAAVRVLESFHREELDSPAHVKVSAPVFDTHGSRSQEIRLLFRLVVPNLPSTLTSDLRQFLEEMAAQVKPA